MGVRKYGYVLIYRIMGTILIICSQGAAKRFAAKTGKKKKTCIGHLLC